MRSLQDGLAKIGIFIDQVLLPTLLGLALLFFIFNVFRYFIIGANDDAAREKAKQLTIYSIAAFVFILSIWGIVNLFVIGLGFDQDESLQPDYIRGSVIPGNNRSNNGGFGSGVQGEFGGTSRGSDITLPGGP